MGLRASSTCPLTFENVKVGVLEFPGKDWCEISLCTELSMCKKSVTMLSVHRRVFCKTGMMFLGETVTKCAYFLNKYFYFFLSLFILRERVCVQASGGGAEREGERESPAGSTLAVQSLTWGWNP